ncbi:MAG: acetyl-CoA carboxylase biotin carboxyl carrier protein [Planctomycetota bacterium]|nr:acetyl-CoA carboxylase biotin carboxyl carrier protein [Planctomycetota bacterium]
MDLKLVKELLALMDEGGLTELHYAHGETEVRLSRQNDAPVVHSVAAPVVAAAPVAPIVVEPEEDPSLYFTSPMVGTFYSRPNPESDAFVEAGDSVGGDDVICILEAMKVFNEIHAEFRGTIIEVLAADGDTVEFGQNLFKYKA